MGNEYDVSYLLRDPALYVRRPKEEDEVASSPDPDPQFQEEISSAQDPVNSLPRSIWSRMADHVSENYRKGADVVAGTVELPINMATGAVAYPIGKVVGAAKGAYEGIVKGNKNWGEEAEKVENAAADLFTYKPVSESGRGAANVVAEIMGLPNKGMEKVMDKAGIKDPNLRYTLRMAGEYATIPMAGWAGKIMKSPQMKNQRGLIGGKNARGWEEAPNKFSSMYDQKERFEIDDSGAKVANAKTDLRLMMEDGGIMPLGRVMWHPELYANYPELMKVKVDVNPEMNMKEGSYNPTTHTITVGYNKETGKIDKGNILHEVQHIIQKGEGFAKGGSPEMFNREYSKEIAQRIIEREKELDRLTEEGNKMAAEHDRMYKSGEHITNWEKWQELTEKINENFRERMELTFDAHMGIDTPYDRYSKLGGEIEARSVAARANLPRGFRSRIDPYESEMGIPIEEWREPPVGEGYAGSVSRNLEGKDRWLSNTGEKIKQQKEPAMKGEEWGKRIKAWGEKDPHIADENKWSGVEAYLDARKGEKITNEEMQQFYEMSKGKWTERKVAHEARNPEDTAFLDYIDRRVREEGGFGKIPKEEVERYNELERREQEILKAGRDPWSSYNIPGGIEGTEKVYTMEVPGKQQFKSSHFPDRKNPVIHFRTQERVLNGKRGIIVETIQSDWHQQRDSRRKWPREDEIRDLIDADDTQVAVDQWREKVQNEEVPPAPFEKTWPEVALKQALDIAAEDPRIEWVAWPEGKVQNERWGKSDESPQLSYYRRSDGKWDVRVDYMDGNSDVKPPIPDDVVKKFWGDDVLNKMKNGEGEETASGKMRWFNLPVDGGFLNVLYDKRLPKFGKKYAEKMGGKYGKGVIEHERRPDHLFPDEEPEYMIKDSYGIHKIEITPEMRKKINKGGQLFYSIGGGLAAKALLDNNNEEEK